MGARATAAEMRQMQRLGGGGGGGAEELYLT